MILIKKKPLKIDIVFRIRSTFSGTILVWNEMRVSRRAVLFRKKNFTQSIEDHINFFFNVMIKHNEECC